MTLPWLDGSHIFFSSAMVSCLMKVFFGLITTVRASKATGSSTYSMPALLQSAISDLRIGREASEMSVSPRQNFLKPPPVPEMPTVTLMDCFLAFWKSSATASVTGYTVLDPSIFTICCATTGALRLAPRTTAKAIDFIGCWPFSMLGRSVDGLRYRIMTFAASSSGPASRRAESRRRGRKHLLRVHGEHVAEHLGIGGKRATLVVDDV